MLFISQKLQANYKSGILINDISDHMPCYLILPDATDHNPSLKIISYRSFTEKIKTRICENIKSVNWQTELDDKDVNEAFTLFHSKLINVIEKFAPTKTKSIKPNKQPRVKWITSGIINSINHNKEVYIKKHTTECNPTNQGKIC